MSLRHQILRGLFALPATALLALVGVFAPGERPRVCGASEAVAPHLAPAPQARVASGIPPAGELRTRLPKG